MAAAPSPHRALNIGNRVGAISVSAWRRLSNGHCRRRRRLGHWRGCARDNEGYFGGCAPKIQQSQAVIGPSEDGGYYLLGLRHFDPGMLRDLPWSEPITRQATEERLQNLGLHVEKTETLFDMDTPQDLDRLEKTHNCPATLGILRKIRGFS